jgi:hypothetical protein
VIPRLRPSDRRALGTVAAGAALAVALASCSSPKANGPTTTTTTAAGGGTVASSTSSASGSTSSTTSLPGTVCQARSLTTAVAGSQGAAGTNEVTFSMRNSSGSPCPMKGYPGAQLLGANGAQLATHVVPGGSYPFTDFAPAQVVLAAGETAYFNLGYSDVPHAGESSCPTATEIAVTPPGASDHVAVTVQLQVCNSGTLTVSPVFVSGGAGSQTTAPPQG